MASNYDSGKKFDVKEFNVKFEQEKERTKTVGKTLDEQRLAKLNKPPPKKQIYELSIGEIIINIKDAWFEILDDLLQQDFTLETLTRNNRLFYIGLTIIIIFIAIYLYDILTEDDIPEPTKEIKEIHHIYHTAKAPTTKKNRYMEAAKNVEVLSPEGLAGLSEGSLDVDVGVDVNDS